MFTRRNRPADEEPAIPRWRARGMMRWSNPRKEIAPKLRMNPRWLLVGETSGRGTATCMVGSEGHATWINILVGAPDHQGGGHGRALVDEADRIPRGVGCPKIYLQMQTTHTKVVAFHERLRFVADELVNPGMRLERD